MPSALLFDFDGLIMDTETLELAIWQELYAAEGQSFPITTWVEQVVGATIANFDPAAHLASLTGRDLDLEAIHRQAHWLRMERRRGLEALPGVRELLAAAHAAGLPAAVVSSSPHAWVDGFLEQLGLAACFAFIVCREDAPRLKPAPDLYLEALARLRLPAGECLAFEDSPNGILAAHRAGLRVVAVPNPVTAHAGPLPADLVLPSLAGLTLAQLQQAFPA